jgi:uncharacterized membrane protein YdbT with pleckstrin-like domain
MKEIDKILGAREKVLWEGNPKFLPYIFSSLIFSIFILITMLIVFLPLSRGGLIFLYSPLFWGGMLFMVGFPLYSLLLYKHIHYAITNKRVIMQTGLIGRDFKMVDFDKITNAEVNVGLIDKLVGNSSGTISISTAGTFVHTKRGAKARPYALIRIADPYKVFKFFKKVSHDIKTDVHYPNKLRPKTNPGYNTGYKPKK